MTPYPAHGTTPASRTLRSRDRGEITAALREHGLDVLTIAEMLDFATLHGDAETTAAKVSFDGQSEMWTADMFGKAQAGVMP